MVDLTHTHTHTFVQLSFRGLYIDFHSFAHPNLEGDPAEKRITIARFHMSISIIMDHQVVTDNLLWILRDESSKDDKMSKYHNIFDQIPRY